jgi:hypothetical protein
MLIVLVWSKDRERNAMQILWVILEHEHEHEHLIIRTWASACLGGSIQLITRSPRGTWRSISQHEA